MFVVPVSRSAVIARRIPEQRAARALDRLFDESLDRFFGGAPAGSTTRTPAMDVSENDTTYTVVFEIPGVTREQLKVAIEGRKVSLTSTAVAEAAPKDGEKSLYRERSSVDFARTVSLPAEVDQATSQAKFDNGLLTLTLAKKVPTAATELSIG